MNWYIEVFKKYAVFSGRARRMEYWMFFLFSMIALVIMAVLDHIFKTTFGRLQWGLFYCIYGLAAFLPGIAVAVRRLHDTNKSGWMYLVGFIPIAGAIWLLILFATAGTVGDNNYGPDPITGAK